MDKIHRKNPQIFTVNAEDYSIDSYTSGNLTIGGLPWFRYLCVANKHGLVVPCTITDEEVVELRKKLPEECEMAVAPPGQFNALGNIIVCNDTDALVHPDLPQDQEDCLKKTLKVRVHRITLAGQSHIG